MSRLDILPAQSPVDFGFVDLSDLADPSHSRFYSENFPDPDPDIIFPGLPPLQRGHPDVHLRNGIMKALTLAADNEPDAEQAFFVADLGQVFMQHQKWKRYLPEIEPFFGGHTRSPDLYSSD